jgi:hypothetical protein
MMPPYVAGNRGADMSLWTYLALALGGAFIGYCVVTAALCPGGHVP